MSMPSGGSGASGAAGGRVGAGGVGDSRRGIRPTKLPPPSLPTMQIEEDDVPYVPVRPWSQASAQAGEMRTEAVEFSRGRTFQPTLPSERRPVDNSLLSMSGREMTAESMLRGAYLRQEMEGTSVMQTKTAPQRFTGMSLSNFGLTPLTGGGHFENLGFGNTNAPRKMKQKKEGGSQDLMDLAFSGRAKYVDGRLKSNYTPISLPFFDIRDEESTNDDETKDASKHRPALAVVDEANANAAKQLFLGEDGDLLDDQIVLMQLPAILPELADPLEDVHREGEESSVSAGGNATINRFPDGLLGKLRIHKSGKVRMEIGGLDFCVDAGCETFFSQDLACVCPLAGEMINLGQIRRRAVVTPDLPSTFAGLASKASAGSSTVAAPANEPATASVNAPLLSSTEATAVSVDSGASADAVGTGTSEVTDCGGNPASAQDSTMDGAFATVDAPTSTAKDGG
eukprot:TRINITY_DN15307_c0_g3_i1.p1 TRINITY_DN15307_c0_g3~~TRINITY_DN15307_c0_g3_i1.p1  ORF type:complete len:455 (-),score=74.39 TRINITY_DN15307_c0_g3_i1:185-1549(-)